MTSKRIRIVLGTALVAAVAGLFALDWFLESRFAGATVAALLGVAGFLEFARMSGVSRRDASGSRALTSVGVLATAYFLGLAWWQGTSGPLPAEWLAAGVVALVLGSFVVVLFRAEFLRLVASLPATILGALLFGLLYSYLLRIYVAHGTFVGVVFVLGVKGTDISAYLVGSSIGRRRYLRVSPGKTVEGSLAALVFGASWFAGAGALAPDVFFSWPLGLLFGSVLAVTSAVGDLAESLLKRYYGVKDSGALLPEFGGVLDLIDSFLFSGFVFWCVISCS